MCDVNWLFDFGIGYPIGDDNRILIINNKR